MSDLSWIYTGNLEVKDSVWHLQSLSYLASAQHAAQSLLICIYLFMILILSLLSAILNEWKAKYENRMKGKDLMTTHGITLHSVNNRHTELILVVWVRRKMGKRILSL